ncbi:MAG TPA: DUF1343 domain-containing protein [Gemmatimonadales bacterium]|nr:DUF1343 domain-containing protein [Gemmatimonadales bacterium]
MRAHHLVCVLLGIACSAGTRAPLPAIAQVRPGIEVLLTDSSHLIAGKRLGLLTNNTGVDHLGRRDVDLLRATHDARLTVLFSPEHGFQGREDRPGLPDGRDSATGLPIYSLYGGSRSAAAAALDSIDILLVDLQDIGARYYTYPATVAQMLRVAAHAGKRVIVLDRPDPVGGTLVQGNVRRHAGDPDSAFVGFLPIAMRHGMTLGELARMADDVLGIGADLVVVPVSGWNRSLSYDQTNLPWIKPSPNMPSLESAFHYPGICLFEGTNVSVGRGTPTAFQVVGAPWLNTAAVLARLRNDSLVGVEIEVTTFTPVAPTDAKYPGVALPGLRFRVLDRASYDPTKLAVALLVALHAVHPAEFHFRDDSFDRLAAGPELRTAVLAGRSAREIWSAWDQDLARFRGARARYLVY